MILADKIINERKKNGWSQEELAEKLSVSRQSVSKWESAQATPDLQKLIKLAEIFGVSTDYLLKEDMEPENASSSSLQEDAQNVPPLRKVSLQEANDYLATKKKTAPAIANAVSMCICCPILLILLSSLSEGSLIPLTENQCGGIGLIGLFVLIAIAVFIFVVQGGKLTRFEYLKKEAIDTEYGVDGMVREKKTAFAPKANAYIAIGILFCIFSVVPLVVASCMDAPDYICSLLVCLLLFMVAIGVNIFIRAGVIKESYSVLLQEGDFTVIEKKVNSKHEAFSTCYWLFCTAAFLLWGFVWDGWGISWVIFPIAGILYAGIMAILKASESNK